MKLTKPQRRALEILRDWTEERRPTAHDFAQKMWPPADAHYGESWRSVHKCGNHEVSIRGAPMWRLGGRMLWGLERKGWARTTYTHSLSWEITPEGQAALFEQGG